MIASWRRAHQQFKVLFLIWFGLPVFAFYFLLSINKAAAPNWDALAFLSLGLLAVCLLAGAPRTQRPCAAGRGVAISALGLIMSLLALDTDIAAKWRDIKFRDAIQRPDARLEIAPPTRWKRCATKSKRRLGEKRFPDRGERDRASEIAFYLRDKRVEGPGHPPVYIVESQDMVNQFSFWPRYDEFVEVQPDAPRPEGEVYTEENGINPFKGRTALYIQSGRKATACRTISSRRFNRRSQLPRSRCVAYRQMLRTLAGFSLPELPDTLPL